MQNTVNAVPAFAAQREGAIPLVEAGAPGDQFGDSTGSLADHRIDDLVVAQSSLQGMPVPVRTLAETLAADLGPRGRIVFTMPNRSRYNRVLNGVRRVWRACRSSLTDRLILGVAARLHPEHSAAFLRDRVPNLTTLLRDQFLS